MNENVFLSKSSGWATSEESHLHICSFVKEYGVSFKCGKRTKVWIKSFRTRSPEKLYGVTSPRPKEIVKHDPEHYDHTAT